MFHLMQLKLQTCRAKGGNSPLLRSWNLALVSKRTACAWQMPCHRRLSWLSRRRRIIVDLLRGTLGALPGAKRYA